MAQQFTINGTPVSELVQKMTLEEKARICTGKNFWELHGFEHLGIPSIMVTDGPHGLRKIDKESKENSLSGSVKSTCFPTACATASSWDPALLYEMGEAMAEECLQEKVSVILGPGVNLKRSPLCGRNFEYFSEDPLLAGTLAAGLVNGVQSKGIGTSLKHFALNNQEKRRMTVSSEVDMRTMRESYLPAFEQVVKEAQPWTVMNAYNRINGEYCSDSEWLQNTLLRDEWGFEGIVVTDWGAANDRVQGIRAGNDLEMPSSGELQTKKIISAVQDGTLDEAVLNKRVQSLLELIAKSMPALEKAHTYDKKAHHAVARKVAGQSMVLLKNEENILPLDQTKSYAVIGEMAVSPRYQGAGSSQINPHFLDNAYDALKEAGLNVTYAQGYQKDTKKLKKKEILDPAVLRQQAVEVAKQADAVLLFIGLTEAYESEGFDRITLALPKEHNALFDAVHAVNPNVVVVLSGGSPVTMPWLPKAKALLNAYLTGQACGSATADILTGKVNPSGKLPETYPLALEDTPCRENYPGQPITVEYRESIYVGYRYYEKMGKDVLFPFGYGLSYTTFAYSDLSLDKTAMQDDETLTVTCKVKNTGSVAGAETAQLYVAQKESPVFRAPKDLRGFQKVYLEPGEEKTVSIALDKRAFAYYNVELGDWHVPSGEFTILVGPSSADTPLAAQVQVTSTAPQVAVPDLRERAPAYYTGDPAQVPDADFAALLGRPISSPTRDPNKPMTIADNIENSAHTKWGGKINRMIVKLTGGESEDGTGKNMMSAMITELPVRNFITMSMGIFDEKSANHFLKILQSEKVFKHSMCLVGRVFLMLPKLPGLLKNI